MAEKFIHENLGKKLNELGLLHLDKERHAGVLVTSKWSCLGMSILRNHHGEKTQGHPCHRVLPLSRFTKFLMTQLQNFLYRDGLR